MPPTPALHPSAPHSTPLPPSHTHPHIHPYREVYQRAIAVPTHALELIWRQYEAFEMAQTKDKQAATRALSEQRPRFQAARMALTARKRRRDGLDAGAWPVPPGKGGPAQEQQLRLWRAYIESERANPQRLERAALATRVALAYEQALSSALRHFPEIWCDYARWHSEAGGGPQDAARALARGAAALPGCLLLHFALADALEALGRRDEARGVFEALVTQMEPDPSAAAAGAVKTEPGAAAAGAAKPEAGAGAGAQQQQQPADGAPQQAQQQQAQQQQQQQQPQQQPPKGGPLMALPEEQRALAWVQYMRFLRRADVAAARRVRFCFRCRGGGLSCAPRRSP